MFGPSVNGSASASLPFGSAACGGLFRPEPNDCGASAACESFVLTDTPLFCVLAPGGTAHAVSAKKAKKLPTRRGSRVFMVRIDTNASHITRSAACWLRLRRQKGKHAPRNAGAGRQKPGAAYTAATARLVFTSDGTVPAVLPDPTRRHRTIARSCTGNTQRSGKRRRPHPALRQLGRGRRVAPGWTRRAHRKKRSMLDLPSDNPTALA
jgi:hypothetical protein